MGRSFSLLMSEFFTHLPGPSSAQDCLWKVVGSQTGPCPGGLRPPGLEKGIWRLCWAREQSLGEKSH